MILNLHSLAFGTDTSSGGGNPAWGTEMGQGDGYRFSFEDCDEFITALVYNSIPNPQQRIYCPLGKGGNQADDYEFVLGSLFHKVFVNGQVVNGKFLLLVVKKLVGQNHVGRKTLKYNPRMTLDGVNYNENCYHRMAEALGVSRDGSWFVSEINVKNQDELHFTAHVLNANEPTIFVDSVDRSRKLQEKLLAYAQNNNNEKIKTFAESIVFDAPLQVIYFGAPGTGKSRGIKTECKDNEHFRITFHPDTDYASFVGSYKPITHSEQVYTNMGDKAIALKDSVTGKAITTTKITYKYVYQAFLNAYIAAWKEQQKENPKPVFLVIEEINRGNCAQIFGDIFQLLDRNDAGYSEYPIVTDNDLKKELEIEFAELSIPNTDQINALYKEEKDVVGKVINGSRLLLPNNLYIRATMNTSDQSLFPIDSAFKRRWEWKYVKIADSGMGYIISVNNNEYDWWQFVSKINEIIGSEIEQEDKKLGYFFAKTSMNADGRYIVSADKFLSKVIFFLYNDVFKDFGFEYDFFKDKNGDIMLFADYFKENGDTDEVKVETFIRNLGLSPINVLDDEEDEIDLESPSNDKKVLIGNVEQSLRRTCLEITRQALEKKQLTLEQLKAIAEKSGFDSTQLMNLYLPLNQKDKWFKEHESDKSPTSRYHFNEPDELTDANGEKFVVRAQWAKNLQTVSALKQYASLLDVSIKIPE